MNEKSKSFARFMLAKNKHIPVSYGSAKKLRQMAKTNNTQNVLAEMELEDMSLKSILEAKPNPFILIFNRLDYEQNLGAILRTAWGAGVDAVVVSTNGVHELTPVVTKVSMGGAANVPLFG
jgi:23S rRNA (guanosine2251-2'-O)-methyltransferase